MTPILEDLAAGRIDAAEASRRIDALTKQMPQADAEASADQPTEPQGEPADVFKEAGDQVKDVWQRGKEQWRTYARETFSRDAEADAAVKEEAGQRPAEPTNEELADETVPPSERRTDRTKGVDRVSIRAVGRRVRVVGEPRVATASVDGAHVLRRNGSVLEINSDGEIGASIDGFTLLRPPRSLDDVRNLGLGKELFIRVNPNVVVDVELTAGSLTTEDVPYLGKVRVTAGGAKMTGVCEANDVLVQAGQATMKGKVTTGRSRVRCESGSLNLHLEEGSNVTVRGESQLGKVAWAGGHSGAGDEVVMGNGSARLDVGVVMGHAVVKVGEGPEEQK